jgi:hypothetical protein
MKSFVANKEFNSNLSEAEQFKRLKNILIQNYRASNLKISKIKLSKTFEQKAQTT